MSAELAAHVAGLSYAALPASTVQATKRAILDGLGVMLAASGTSPDVGAFVEIARHHGGPAQASILGFRERVSLPMAAFANGSMAHALDYEDTFDAAGIHPNASLLPAALAVAEAFAPVSGRDLITAIAVGCDLTCRLGLSLQRPLSEGGWYPPPILGAFGAAAACARLLQLSPQQVCDAWSLVLCQNSCPMEIANSPQSSIRAVREALPANAAVLAVLLARGGVRGFEQPFEGKSAFFRLYAADRYSPEPLLEALGRKFHIDALSFKKWPSCRGTHPYIEAAQVLRCREKFDVNSIVNIRIVGNELHRMLCEPIEAKRAPQTVIGAKFSVPFTVAAALVQPEVTLDSFAPGNLRNSEILSLAAKCQFALREGDESAGAPASELELFLKDGRSFRHSVSELPGSPTRPLDDAELLAKFVDCAGRAAVPVAPAAATRLAGSILALEDATDVTAILTQIR